MTKRIFRSILIVAAAVMAASIVIIVSVFYSYLEQEYLTELKNEAYYAAAGYELAGLPYLESLRDGETADGEDDRTASRKAEDGGTDAESSKSSGESSAAQADSAHDRREMRVTLIAGDGTVIFDSRTDAEMMENHAEREEVREALASGEGSSWRYSDTMDEKTLNYAVLTADGNILRISGTQFSVWALLKSMSQMILIVLAIAVVLSCFLAYRLAKLIVRPLNSIDFEHPENTAGLEDYVEIRPLLEKLHLQNKLLYNEMAQREKMRREFTANVSHELKTPLTSISGFAEIIRDGFVEEEDIPRFSGRIYTESQRMISLVDDVIRLAELEEHDLQQEYQQVDLSPLIDEVVWTLTPAAKSRNIEFIKSTEPAEVMGIQQILTEMIYNLCDNAVKYNKDGGVVRVSLKKKDGKILLSVSDTGIGIPEEEQARVFERFYRVDKSHSKEVGGTGLGLAIVKHGAAFHNAEINLRSRVGEGTDVTLCFDVKQNESGALTK